MSGQTIRNQHMFKKLIQLILFLPSIVLAAEFTQGKDYQLLANPKAKPDHQVVIVEFFSYGCPWCYRIEAPLHEWLGKREGKVQLLRVPVVFKANWELYAKAYYTAKILALSDKLDPLLFKTIQTEKNSLDNTQAMIRFFVSQGIDKEIAKSAFENSPTVDMQVSKGMQLMTTYLINAVPAFVVNNQYKTDLQMAGSPERLFQILDYLEKK